MVKYGKNVGKLGKNQEISQKIENIKKIDRSVAHFDSYERYV